MIQAVKDSEYYLRHLHGFKPIKYHDITSGWVFIQYMDTVDIDAFEQDVISELRAWMKHD